MALTGPGALTSGKERKQQDAQFNKARKDLFKKGNSIHAKLDIKVRISLWYNSRLHEYSSAADIPSSLGDSDSTSMQLWTPKDFVSISPETSKNPGVKGEESANDPELYHIASQVMGIVNQDTPGLTDTGSAQETPSEPTLVDPAEQPPIIDLTTPEPETSSQKTKQPPIVDLTTPEPTASRKRANTHNLSPHRQLRRRKLGPAWTDFDPGKEPESPPSWQRRMDKHFGLSSATQSSIGGVGGAVRRTSTRHLRRATPY
ncbi:hypothetical protein F5883DRAFT_584955 [Diaporthe sp. PMI_573]|nr:hypothetical protein F5883DRAFT_584955 [Diaporthaceae sp. PMI_573]